MMSGINLEWAELAELLRRKPIEGSAYFHPSGLEDAERRIKGFMAYQLPDFEIRARLEDVREIETKSGGACHFSASLLLLPLTETLQAINAYGKRHVHCPTTMWEWNGLVHDFLAVAFGRSANHLLGGRHDLYSESVRADIATPLPPLAQASAYYVYRLIHTIADQPLLEHLNADNQRRIAAFSSFLQPYLRQFAPPPVFGP